MSDLTDQILECLTSTGGNSIEVAAQLSVSQEYVNRIKRQQWKPNGTPTEMVAAQPKALVPAVSKEQTLATLAPNLLAVRDLRDEILEELRYLVKKKLLPAKELAIVLKILLTYEQRAVELSRPALNLYDQRHQVAVGTDVLSKLDTLSQAQLRALVGVDDPIEIIDGELIHD